MAGNSALRATLHRHFGDRMKYSGQIGLTHRDTSPDEPELPGAKPTWFFAPDQIRKRAKEWGPGGIDKRFSAAWSGFAPMLENCLEIVEGRGPAAVRQILSSTRWPAHSARSGPYAFLAGLSGFLPVRKAYSVPSRGSVAQTALTGTHMLDKTEDISAVAENWLAEFETALARVGSRARWNGCFILTVSGATCWR